MARDIDVSHATINKIDIGGREPGRRVLEALAAQPKINPAWVLSGAGEPYVGKAAAIPHRLPICDAAIGLLPQVVGKGKIKESIDCSALFTSTQFWLSTDRHGPLTDGSGFREHDLLLMETDRTAFPAERRLDAHLCVVLSDVPNATPTLCSVSYHQGSHDDGPARLEAEILERQDRKTKYVEEIVVRRFPSAELRVSSRRRKLTTFRGKDRVADVADDDLEPPYQVIPYSQIAAVWTGILMRKNQLA